MMRRILVSQFVTLDGVMEAPEKWNSTYASDPEVVASVLADFSASDQLLLGRTSYELFAARWPSRTGQMADYFNNLPKLVVSSSLQTPAWNNTTVIKGSTMVEIRKLKERPGKNILVFGSYQLVQTLRKENLVDEYKLYVYPLVLGKGKRLFEQGEQTLRLITAKQFASGVISATYRTEKI